ncbi:DNA nucleotidylexotransferase [Chanos chanos]|uniref:DNA nucleotidylexotransferase n=1 Tax=Chanos chanos TaxID=29144 RepID=A0A6J2V8I8_CHACN|nr:DNA nucleotidylexotransferase [Chanos chanos]
MLQSPFLPPVRKRRRPEMTPARVQHEVRFEGVTLYLVERRMGSSRRNFLTHLARSKGFCVHDILSSEVTHIVAEGNPAEELWSWLEEHHLRDMCNLHVLDIRWFTESMQAGRPVAVETRHYIQKPSSKLKTALPATSKPTVSQYACQRRTTLDNQNKIFTDAFEVLAESNEFLDSRGQCLAFRRAASVLKSLQFTLRSLDDIEGLPCLGEQIKSVIEEIFEFRTCSKVEEILRDEKYQTLKLFTSVFGVGPKTAEKWYRKGLRTLKAVLAEPDIHLNKMQEAGFLYYEDISKSVSKADAQAVETLIKDTISYYSSDTKLFLTGGFRRGKEHGHDVDFILTTPEIGKEQALLLFLIDKFKNLGILLYSDFQESTFDIQKLPSCKFEAMDHFPKCFLILKLKTGEQTAGVQQNQNDSRDWKAIRVDLVAPPADRYAFAMLGWTGSTQFERDLRRYARKERRMLLDNHALYDKTKHAFLEAQTEEEIFDLLGLEYIEPWQRNA